MLYKCVKRAKCLFGILCSFLFFAGTIIALAHAVLYARCLLPRTQQAQGKSHSWTFRDHFSSPFSSSSVKISRFLQTVVCSLICILSCNSETYKGRSCIIKVSPLPIMVPEIKKLFSQHLLSQLVNEWMNASTANPVYQDCRELGTTTFNNYCKIVLT